MNKRQLATSSLLTGTLLLSACITASDPGEGLANESDAVLLKNQDGNYQHWNGIGKIFWNNEPSCTATLLDTRDRNNKAVGPGYLLTAAHCLPGISAPGYPLPKETVKFNYFNDTLKTSKSYTIKEAVWKDYRDVDLAILELDTTLAALLDEGITPLSLASEWAKDVNDVLIVGAPERFPEAGLRLAACAQEPTAADLVERYRISFNTFKNLCSEIRPGSSGSPVLDRKNGQILSVLTTGNFDWTIDEQCFKDAPCEVKNGQTKWTPNASYSHPAEYLSACFSEGVFTDVANACTLSDAPFKVNDLKDEPTRYVRMPSNATRPDPVLKAEFTLSSRHYRFKTVRNAIDCRSPHNYSDIIDAKDAKIEAPISRELGMHYLCVVGVDSAEQRPGAELMKSAWAIPALLAARTPVKMPELTITLTTELDYDVQWRHTEPHYYGTFYYTGPVNETDCSKVPNSEYTSMDYYPVMTFEAKQLPLTLCTVNQDMTLRSSKPRTDLLTLP